MATKKKTPELAVIAEHSSSFQRAEALELAIKMFTNTPMKVLMQKAPGEPVYDLPFYQVAKEFESYLVGGNFKGLDKWNAEQEALSSAKKAS